MIMMFFVFIAQKKFLIINYKIIKKFVNKKIQGIIKLCRLLHNKEILL